MAVKYAYHPGNVAHSSAIEVAETMPPVARSLGRSEEHTSELQSQ